MTPTQNKITHYTPLLSDFHIGFIYEEQTPETSNWNGHVFNEKDLFKIAIIKHTLDQCMIRVKHLDQKDIEIMSFIFNTTNGMRNWYILEGSFETPGTPYKVDKYVLIHDPEMNWIKIECFFGDSSDGVLFEGTAKNLNEFEKILRQINVIK